MTAVTAGFSQAGENESKKATSGQGLFQEAERPKNLDQGPTPVAADAPSQRGMPSLVLVNIKQTAAHSEVPAPEKAQTQFSKSQYVIGMMLVGAATGGAFGTIGGTPITVAAGVLIGATIMLGAAMASSASR